MLQYCLFTNRLKDRAQAGAQVQKNDFNKTERTILAYLEKGPSSRANIVDHLGSGSRSGHLKKTLQGLLQKDLIKYTYPDSPTHPNQKYEITEVGKQYVE